MSGTYTLPSADVIAQRLRAVDGSLHVVEHLHSRIIRNLRAAGRHLPPESIVLMINAAIEEYAAPFPHLTANIQYEWLRRYVTELIKDEQVRKEALRLLQG